MLTPAISSEIWKSYCVTCRAQPPFWMRRGALLNDAQNIGRSPTFVAGGEKAPGNWVVIAGLFGAGSVRLQGLSCVLVAPPARFGRRCRRCGHPWAQARRAD